MKIFSAEQIRNWDAYTIANEPIASIDLMERAAAKCTEWLIHNNYSNRSIHIFCGKGNNGGDGLAIARMLLQKKCSVTVYILEFGFKGTEDFQINLQRLHEQTRNIHFLQSATAFPLINSNDTVIDAILGTGLNKPAEGLTAALIEHINSYAASVIAIDIPTGMYADKSCKNNPVVFANHTLSFQQMKECFLVPENAEACGEIHLLNIGLHPAYAETTAISKFFVDKTIIQSIYKKRKPFAHKGYFGHALIVAGSYGKTGAAVLCGEACLRSGAGLLTVHVPTCGYTIIQTALPEAMVTTDSNANHITNAGNDLLHHAAIGTGPGLGLHESTGEMLVQLLKRTHQPVVLDADALNLLSIKKNIPALLREDCILTPHPKEFERLFGQTANDFERNDLALQKAKELNCVIVLKMHYTLIACPNGNSYYNSTGNAGMATAGSGDILTGILTGLLAQGYNTIDAAILGVYLHGIAGDYAAAHLSEEAMIARDIIQHTGKAFQSLQ
jgi:NAD(P)H-hydrate epimerase